jgi:hypothetical protein
MALPATGQASFVGAAQGTAFRQSNGSIGGASVIGAPAFFRRFRFGQNHGRLHQHGSWAERRRPLERCFRQRQHCRGTNRFRGATAVASTPSGLFTLSGTATGSITGAFYGPTAQNLGAIWTLSDGTTSAIGGVLAGR